MKIKYIFKNLIVLFAILGISSTFMPWVHYPNVDISLYGYQGDGILTGVIFSFIFLYVVFSFKKKNFSKLISFILGGLGLLMAIISFFKKQNLTLAVFLIVVAFISSCSSSHKFPVEYGPNKNYNISLITESSTVVSLSGDQQRIAQVAQNGVSFPMEIENSSLLNVTVNTGELDNSNNYPAKIYYTQGHNILSTNGEQTKEVNPFSGLVVHGVYDSDQNFSIQTAENFQLDEYLKEEIRKSMNDLQLILSFPNEGMQIGDQFIDTKPMDLPLVGLEKANLTIFSTYILKEIENNKAYFDIEQTVELTDNGTKNEIDMFGSGEGNVEYDVKNTVISSFKNDIFIELNLSVNAVLVNSKSNVKTHYKVTAFL
ncbi:hypothetical protein OAD00_03715 [Saprospiraceae bacterium]|nr:hypothetical protein [Saprospiraceae bacterium]MDA9332483.1 hypothetical protein [Saprospiraceae bacterium]MDA9866490.1 hypothetical protein [Saprospiraceae bacterium]MDB9914944.1 hypothetical protein [Saprospiraceae bacterium]